MLMGHGARTRRFLQMLALAMISASAGCKGGGGNGGSGNPPPDTTPPTVSITFPANGASVSGTITVSATATDPDSPVSYVQFQVDGGNTGGQVKAAPYSISLDTTKLSNASHALKAIAVDPTGNTGNSAAVTVTVTNNTPPDTTPPTVSITSPANGASVSGTITVSANAADNVAVASVQFRVDGNNTGNPVTAAPYTFSLNTATLTNASHTLTAVAKDTSNNTATSAGVTVTVNNAAPPDTTPPTVSITAPPSAATAFGITVAGNTTLTAIAADNVGVASVQFKVDGNNTGNPIPSAPFSSQLNTTTLSNAPHTITAVARDAAGNQTTSVGVTVTVSNSAPVTGAAGPLIAAGTSQPASNYFKISGTSTVVFLAGSHTWNDMQDEGNANGTTGIDFTAFVNFLLSHRQNATILWHKDLPQFCNWGAGGTWTITDNGFPWARSAATGASDGHNKWDLNTFNQTYFDTLRMRAVQLQQNGIYAIIQLFDGLGLSVNRCGTTSPTGDGYPLTGVNNTSAGAVDDGYTSGAAGSTASMTNSVPNSMTAVQVAYMQKVVDTLNLLPNVIWEVSEEAPDASTAWQTYMIAQLKAYETAKAYTKHPVLFPTLDVSGASDTTLYNSNADVIAPRAKLSSTNNCSGSGTPTCKVDLNDSDHSYFGMWKDLAQMNRNYLWENFTHGASIVFMDPYLIFAGSSNSSWTDRNKCDNTVPPFHGVCSSPDPRWDNFRNNMGYVLTYANTKLDLLKMSAQTGLASTTFCLADNVAVGGEFLVYAPNGGSFTVNLSTQAGRTLNIEWLDPSSGAITNGGTVPGGSSSQPFSTPASITGDAVLYLVDTAGHN
jgi:Big-like domain-containing protein/collagenase-like protein with putative collagen-binding domain